MSEHVLSFYSGMDKISEECLWQKRIPKMCGAMTRKARDEPAYRAPEWDEETIP